MFVRMAVRVFRAIPVGNNGTHESRNVLLENRDIKLMRRRRIGEGKGWARVEREAEQKVKAQYGTRVPQLLLLVKRCVRRLVP